MNDKPCGECVFYEIRFLPNDGKCTSLFGSYNYVKISSVRVFCGDFKPKDQPEVKDESKI